MPKPYYVGDKPEYLDIQMLDSDNNEISINRIKERFNVDMFYAIRGRFSRNLTHEEAELASRDDLPFDWRKGFNLVAVDRASLRDESETILKFPLFPHHNKINARPADVMFQHNIAWRYDILLEWGHALLLSEDGRCTTDKVFEVNSGNCVAPQLDHNVIPRVESKKKTIGTGKITVF